jgi:hypothetical protein
MITLKSGICSKESCIIHAKLLGKRARFRVCALKPKSRSLFTTPHGQAGQLFNEPQKIENHHKEIS